jgi:hypothetical protein
MLLWHPVARFLLLGFAPCVCAVPGALEEPSIAPQETPAPVFSVSELGDSESGAFSELSVPEFRVQQPHGPLMRVPETYFNDSYYEDFPPNAINFHPRLPKITHSSDDDHHLCDFEEDCEREDKPLGLREGLLWFGLGLEPSKTTPEKLSPRSTFSFNCPTSIECPDAGCCFVESYCAVIEGQIVCCDLPLGKECLAFPNPACAMPCSDSCCDSWNGPDPNGALSGDVVCNPVPGLNPQFGWDDHTPAFRCEFAPANPTHTVSCLGGTGSLCGGACCPNKGFVCNKNIPGIEFCDPLCDPNLSAGVTVVSQLGFNAQEFNTNVGAHPTNISSGESVQRQRLSRRAPPSLFAHQVCTRRLPPRPWRVRQVRVRARAQVRRRSPQHPRLALKHM